MSSDPVIVLVRRELIELEAAEPIGAGRYERTDIPMDTTSPKSRTPAVVACAADVRRL